MKNNNLDHNLDVVKEIPALDAKSQNTLVALVMLYVTVKITCNILFFNRINLSFFSHNLKITEAAFLYPLVFVLLTWIASICTRKQSFYIVILGGIMDGLFSNLVFTAHLIAIPKHLSVTEAYFTSTIHNISGEILKLYYNGVFASACSYITEVFLFIFILDKIKTYWISSFLSISILLAVHGIICDYPMFKVYPNTWNLIISNYSINLIILLIYVFIASYIKKLITKNESSKIPSNIKDYFT